MKRVIICLDGTWNDKRTGPDRTNVAKICDAVAPQDRHGTKQDAHYVEGIATTGSRKWLTFLNGAVGVGVGDRIKAGYETLAAHYEPGDEVFIFGFSRGAFEARSLAGFISIFGIAKPGGTFSFEDAWQLYRRRPKARNDATLTRIREAAHYPARIKCVGVWDTVGNIGNPFVSSGWLSRRFKFHQIQMTDAIDVGLHALCVDEVRGPFRPSLWTLGPGEELSPGQHVEQVWMPGTHADVGGGWRETQLSDIGLTWMMERVSATTGLELDVERIWLAERARELTGLTSTDARFPAILEMAGRLGKLAGDGQEGERRQVLEQLRELTGRKLDVRLLRSLPAAPRPDALGPQHASATGAIFKWSGIFPFIRLIDQNMDAIPSWRRSLIGGWRTGKLPAGRVVVNESVHPSARERFGEEVIELSGSKGKRITYAPANLAAVLPTTEPAAPAPSAAKPRRVKIFTVHGTFAHEAEWDNWDPYDAEKKADPKAERNFVNRLSDGLRSRGVAFDKLDHTEFNWSGGNSHDERRIAAVGLKKLIETELARSYEAHGRDYYDAIYIIGHSHGGTVARLCMNLWDKNADYYIASEHAKAHAMLKSDDQCPICLRERNGLVAANSVARPTGVITFGSPFVTFEKRGGGLLTVNIAVRLYQILAIIPVGFALAWIFKNPDKTKLDAGSGVDKAQLSLIQTAIEWLWPLAFYWFATSYVAKPICQRLERSKRLESWLGESLVSRIVWAIESAVKYGLIAFLAIYYLAYVVGGWERVVYYMPFLKSWKDSSVSATAVALFWLLIVTWPGRFRAWMKSKVQDLKELLPAKYDPVEDKPVRYLSYHTLGDEAGFHLRTFGTITWLVQTLSLAAACVLTFGFVLAVYVGLELVLLQLNKTGILTLLAGVSAFSETPEGQQNFVEFVDRFTRWPAMIWHNVFGLGPDWKLNLGDLPNSHAAVPSYPTALAAVIALVGFGIMPLVVALIGIAYLVSMRLRGSGLVFGSESAAWTMANRIAATPRANDNTIMRNMFITPEAWWKQEMAHCYYYKCDRVIEDVASHIADWDKHAPSRIWSFEKTIATTLRWLVAAFCVASLFAFAVPMADSFARPKPIAPEAQCKGEAHEVSTEVGMTAGQEVDLPASVFMTAQAKAQAQWASEVSTRDGAAWSTVANAKNPKTNGSGGHFACTPQADPGQLRFACQFKATPCLAAPKAESQPAASTPSPAAAPAPARR